MTRRNKRRLPRRRFLQRTVFSATALSGGRRLLASPATPIVRVVTPVSAPFRAQVEAVLGSVPPRVWRGLQGSGWDVRVSRFVVDAAPWLRFERPRGWPAGSTWEQVDAVHLPNARVLVVAEWRRTRQGQKVANQRVAGVLRHELGHAYDMVSGGRFRFHSATPAFVRAYRDDVARRPGATDPALAYYLQGNAAGRQETFAEAFGIVLGGGSDEPNRRRFVHRFAGVVDQLQNHLQPTDSRPAAGG